MKNSLLILAGAAAISLASCTQEKTTETTAATDGATTTTTTTTTAPLTDAQIEARAQRIADKMVADMKITDEATKTKIRTVYVNRYKRMNEMRTKYTTDTTGMAAAMREGSMAEDQEFKTIFTDPTQYQSYQSSRSTYDDSNYADDNASSTSMSDTASSSMAPASSMTTTEETTTTTTDNSTGAAGADVSKMKAKGDDGSKIKIKDNGKVKTKDAEGNKSKN